MALRVWLPLNGDLNNQGLNNIGNLTVNSLTLNDNGKIGKAYKGNGIYHLPNDILNNTWTIALWVKQDGTWSQYNDILLCKNNATSDDGQFYFSIVGGSRLNIGINHHAEQYSYNYTFQINVWYHVAASYDGANYALYLNGSQVAFGTDTSTYDGLSLNLGIGTRSQNSDGTSSWGGSKIINDVRIYDECLSQKQIKEISKGLIAHYKLDTARTLNNLRRNQSFGTYNNFSSAGATCTVAKTGEKFNGAEVWRMTYTPVESNLSHVQTTLHGHGVTGGSSTYSANTKYCYWLLCKPISHPDTIIGGTASNIGGWTEIPMKEYGCGWYIVGQKRTGAVTENKTDNIFTSFKTPSATAGTPIIIDFCCPHLVEGYDEILPEFDYQGTVVTQERDVSGNGYNGTITGTLTFNPDSSRYDGSTYFNGSSYLTSAAGSMSWVNFDNITISAWMKPTTTPGGWTGSIGIQPDAGSSYKVFSISNYGGKFSVHTSDGTFITTQSNTLPINTWSHCVATLENGTNLKMYINGKLVKTATIDYKTTTVNSNTRIAIGVDLPGDDEKYTGYYSDARIYATALSANEILTMYKNSGIIDNKGNVYAYEFKEE